MKKQNSRKIFQKYILFHSFQLNKEPCSGFCEIPSRGLAQIGQRKMNAVHPFSIYYSKTKNMIISSKKKLEKNFLEHKIILLV